MAIPSTHLDKSAIFAPCEWLELLHYVIINDMITCKLVSHDPSIRIKEVWICEDLLYLVVTTEYYINS